MKHSNKKNQIKKKRVKYPLRTIYFYLTEGCNLRCRHCWIQPKYQNKEFLYPSLDLKVFKDIIEQALPIGLSSVKLTGGEPLLHPDIHKIIDHLRTLDLRVIMETNGVLCTPEIARKLKKCKYPFISVSLDGTDAKTNDWVRGVEGSFDQAVKGIQNLVKAEHKPQIIMTLMRRNKDQVEDMLRLAESLDVGSVKYNILQPMARGKKMHKEGEALDIEELIELGKWVEHTLSPSTNIRLHYSHPPAFRSLGNMFGRSGDGCSVCGIFHILGVLSDGSYALCGIGETVPEFVFGNASKDRLEDIWKNSPVLKEIREKMPERLKGICHDCLMKNSCLGNCVAQNYYLSKDLLAPYWFCEEAEKRNLFPETRRTPKKAG